MCTIRSSTYVRQIKLGGRLHSNQPIGLLISSEIAVHYSVVVYLNRTC